jgi:hypothetical protein
MHYVGAEFVDITGSVDAVNNVICGETTSLSPFAIVEPAQPAPSVGGIADLPDVPAAHLEGSPSGGSRIPVSEEVAAALAAGVVVLGVGGWYAKGRWQNARGK